MTKIIRIALCLTLLFAVTSTSQAGIIALEITNAGTPEVDTSQKRTWGWQFKPTQAITVDSLGAFYVGNANSNHEVGLWLSRSGTDPLATATVTPTSPIQGSDDGGVFRYRSLRSPVKLAADTLYVIGMTMGSDEFYIGGSVKLDPIFDSTTSGFRRDSGESPTGELLYPSSSQQGFGYYGPNFTFSRTLDGGNVPEPSSLAIFAIGAMGLVGTRRRRPHLRNNRVHR